MKIVVFDDVAKFVNVIKEILTRHGHEVLAIQIQPTDRCEDIAKKINEFQPEIIFADWHLNAHFNGEQLLEKIGGLFFRPKLKDKGGNPRVVSISTAEPDPMVESGVAHYMSFSAKKHLDLDPGNWSAKCLADCPTDMQKDKNF